MSFEFIQKLPTPEEIKNQYALPEALAETYPTPTFTADSIPGEADIAQVNNWMVERGLLDEAYDYTEMVDTSFIEN